MARHRGPVLVDTNVILECFRVGAWRALSGGYSVETVEDCVTETQTGYQRRRAELQIDAAHLVATLKAVHPVTDAERAVVAIRDPRHRARRRRAILVGACADEKRCLGSLWARQGQSALRRPAGLTGSAVALEALLADAGHRPKEALKSAYTTKWLEKVLGELFISEGLGRS